MSAGSAYKEGTTLTPMSGSANQEYRRSNRCSDTNNNSADFQLNGTSSSPHNASSPAEPCGGPTNPSVVGVATPTSVAQGAQTVLTATVTPGSTPPSTGITVTGNLSSIGGSPNQAFLDNGVDPDATAGDNIFSFRATVPAATSPGLKSIPVTATDAQSRSGNGTIQFTVTSSVATRIHDIQGTTHLSPLAGQSVSNVLGIVTLKRQVGSGPVFGFYIQDAPANYDTDDRTSEAVLVFTNNDPVPAVNVGDAVLVTGTVTEFRSGGASSANLATTEIVATAANIAVQSSRNPLPPATVIGTGGRIPPATVIDDDAGPNAELGTFEPANDGIDFWESLEGMRLQVNNAVATSPRVTFTSSNTQELVVLGDGGANSNSRSARGGVILRCVPSLPGDVSHCDAESDGQQNDGIDFNPERIFLQAPSPASTDAASSPPSKGLLDLSVNVRDSFPGQIVGVLDYTFGNFKLLVTTVPTKASGGLTKEVTSLVADGERVTIGSFNVENIDPGDPPQKFADIAGVIVNNMRSPDIVGVEEIQDNNGPTNDGTVAADQTYGLLINAIVAAGGPQYQFRQIDPINNQEGGEPGGNIRVGFLFNPARIEIEDRIGPGSVPTGNTTGLSPGGSGKPQLDSNPGRLQDPDPSTAFYPGGTANAFQSSRRPLVAEFKFRGRRLFLVNNHLNSKGGDQSPFVRFQPQNVPSETQRREQAKIVRDFVTSILAIDPAANVVVLGDLNDFHFSRPVSILETLEGTLPTTQRLHDLLETLPENERYTYVFDGNSQSLDGGILVSNNLRNNASFEYDVVHVNAEFQDQVSDHEAQVVRLLIPNPSQAKKAGP